MGLKRRPDVLTSRRGIVVAGLGDRRQFVGPILSEFRLSRNLFEESKRRDVP